MKSEELKKLKERVKQLQAKKSEVLEIKKEIFGLEETPEVKIFRITRYFKRENNGKKYRN